jgi:ATP-dependent Clp protease ATP-binding subunit ClpC
MFEHYTEAARRIIFFARFEASVLGSRSIETEHLLLGLIREAGEITTRLIGDSTESIKRTVWNRTVTAGEKVSTTIDMPLSNECIRILAFAAEEAELLMHRHIIPVHLLLGMLREEQCLAGTILREHGLQLDSVRQQLSRP